MNITSTEIFTNVTRIEHLVDAANQVSGGAFLGATLIAIYFIIWFSVPAEFEKKTLTAFWLCFVLSIILRAGGLIGWVYVTVFFLGGLMTYLYLMFTNK